MDLSLIETVLSMDSSANEDTAINRSSPKRDTAINAFIADRYHCNR